MFKKQYLYIFIIINLFSCAKERDTEISFYHWKSKAIMNSEYKNALTLTNTKTIYLHYFDIKPNTKGELFPEYFLRKVDADFKKYNIVPVVYIVNSVFKRKVDIDDLVEKTAKLIKQINKKQFNKEFKTIQIDCDWTLKTKQSYFEFLKKLAKEFDINVTIRLHQIKFQKKTGIPPVKQGTLMLYNVGNLKTKTENSILEDKIVAQYINTNTKYPLQLSLALPLFSQTIIRNNNDEIKIIKNTNRFILENDIHFKKADKNNFTVIKDTLYKGFYLNKNYNLKLEELSEKEIINSYKTIEKSGLNIQNIIFYHLDSLALKNINLKEIIKNIQ